VGEGKKKNQGGSGKRPRYEERTITRRVVRTVYTANAVPGGQKVLANTNQKPDSSQKHRGATFEKESGNLARGVPQRQKRDAGVPPPQKKSSFVLSWAVTPRKFKPEGEKSSTGGNNLNLQGVNCQDQRI